MLTPLSRYLVYLLNYFPLTGRVIRGSERRVLCMLAHWPLWFKFAVNLWPIFQRKRSWFPLGQVRKYLAYIIQITKLKYRTLIWREASGRCSTTSVTTVTSCLQKVAVDLRAMFLTYHKCSQILREAVGGELTELTIKIYWQNIKGIFFNCSEIVCNVTTTKNNV